MKEKIGRIYFLPIFFVKKTVFNKTKIDFDKKVFFEYFLLKFIFIFTNTESKNSHKIR
jgi:hypothetical protein